MAWIETIDEEDAEDELADVYERIADERGKIANIMKVHSLEPQTMLDHVELYTTLLFSRSGLGREQREMIATVVSDANDCEYCVHHHAVALKAYWRDEKRLEAFVAEWRSLDLSDRERAMLEYAERLTEAPDELRESDVEALREAGFDDREILQINLVASYFNFVNRIAEGLGVDFTPEEMAGYDY